MGRLMALCAGMIVLATLAPAVWSQEAAAPATTATPATTAMPEDPLANALAVVKAPTVARTADLDDARNFLVNQRQVTRPLVAQLLGDADAQVRMNAAIVLSEMANAGDTSAATLQALQTAATDKEFAVAYWGFQGLMSNGVPAANQSTVISEMMKPERPRALRLAALMTIDEKKLTPAAPIIISHLQEILKEYKAQVETLVTSAATIERTGPGPATRPGGFPAPTFAPPQPASPPTGAPPGGMPPGPPGGGRFLPGFMNRGSLRPPGSGVPTPGAPTPGPAMPGPATPGPAAPGEPRRPEMPTQEVAQVRRADLADMTLDQLQALARGVEALPIVAEVHQMGLVLEDIVSNNAPDAPLFDFKSTAPWDLDKCVDKAVIYMNSHRAEYGLAPAAPKPPAPTPEAPPAAPPATNPAPATTAATPASTTPAP